MRHTLTISAGMMLSSASNCVSFTSVGVLAVTHVGWNVGKDKKKADKVKAKAPAADSGSSPLTITENELRAALDKIRNEEVPAGADDRHQYFLSQLSMGEQLCQQGMWSSIKIQPLLTSL